MHYGILAELKPEKTQTWTKIISPNGFSSVLGADWPHMLQSYCFCVTWVCVCDVSLPSQSILSSPAEQQFIKSGNGTMAFFINETTTYQTYPNFSSQIPRAGTRTIPSFYAAFPALFVSCRSLCWPQCHFVLDRLWIVALAITFLDKRLLRSCKYIVKIMVNLLNILWKLKVLQWFWINFRDIIQQLCRN